LLVLQAVLGVGCSYASSNIALSVCLFLSVCWTHGWAVQKWLNRSRYHFGDRLSHDSRIGVKIFLLYFCRCVQLIQNHYKAEDFWSLVRNSPINTFSLYHCTEFWLESGQLFLSCSTAATPHHRVARHCIGGGWYLWLMRVDMRVCVCSPRSRHQCCAVTFPLKTSTSSLGPETRRPLCMKWYSELENSRGTNCCISLAWQWDRCAGEWCTNWSHDSQLRRRSLASH